MRARVPADNVAYVLAYRSEVDRAFEWLDMAAGNGDTALAGIVTKPLLASLHSDPRWLPFLEKIGKALEQLTTIEFNVTLPEWCRQWGEWGGVSVASQLSPPTVRMNC